MMKILVVDDEAPIRDWIVYSIEREAKNFLVVGSAKSGKEAYEMVLKHKPDVVITDIKMPGIDGIELMQMVKKVQPYTVFIILTNYAEFAYAKKAITFGAKEYLLKSELRSIDLINILNDSYKAQLELTEGKKAEILSSGYTDLYSLYQNIEDEDYHIHFWQGLGMDMDKPYGILGIGQNNNINQRTILTDIFKEIDAYYFNAALSNQSIYIILQEKSKEELKNSMEKFSRYYFRSTKDNIIVGNIKENLKNILSSVEIIETTLIGTFFEIENKVLYYEDLLKPPKLDRNSIRKEYKEILDFISLKHYSEARERLNIWFDHFSNLNIEDILWARDMAIKIVISMEERFYEINSESEGIETKTTQLNSIDKCKKISILMLEKMERKVNGSKSRGIDQALSFIHSNFNQDISLVAVANHIYRSPEYFSRLFKEEVGVNFSVYLIMYRLNYAKKLLATNDLQISQIAFEVGYTNPGYFSRIFKKYMGMTPEEYRSQENTKKSK